MAPTTSKLRFLCDEDSHPAIIAAMRQLEPTVDVIRVGEPGAPPSGTKDPQLLIAAESLGRTLFTNDKSSMPMHLVNHFAAGHHTAGVMLLRQGYSIGRYAQEIINHWRTSTADQWIDRTVYIP